MFGKLKYRVMMVRLVGDVPNVIEVRKLNLKTKRVQVGTKLFEIDVNLPYYRRREKMIYMLDVDNGQVTTRSHIPAPSAVMVKKVWKDEVIRQFTSGMEGSLFNMTTIIIVILAAGMGLALGYILGGQFTTPAAGP